MVNFLPKNLRSIRQKWRYSQDDFGEIFELKTGVISTYERDASEPRINFLVKLFELTGIPIQNLLIREISEDEIPEQPGVFTLETTFGVNDPPGLYQKPDPEVEKHHLMNFYKLIKEVEDLRWALTKMQIEIDQLKSKQ